jgi:phosphoribosylaminoimidazole (AIR) synthetase
MLEIIAPYLASIGVHKNGTWAAQKIIETCKLPSQVKKKKKKKKDKI